MLTALLISLLALVGALALPELIFVVVIAPLLVLEALRARLVRRRRLAR